MSATLASLLEPGAVVETPFWDAVNDRRARATVTGIVPVGDRLKVEYVYPSGHSAYQMLRPWDPIPVPDTSDPLSPSAVDTG